MKNRLYNKIVLFLLVFAVYLITAFAIYPIAQTTGQDELTTIGWAALFAGRNWNDVLSFRKYYGFGYSILFTPLFWVTESPIIIYRCMLVCNAIVNGISSVLAYSSMQMLEEDNKEMTFWLSIAMSFIPLKIVNFVNETIIICIIWGIIYVLGRALKEPHKKKRNTLAILSVLLYSVTIHTRLLLLIALVTFCIIFIDLYKKIRVVNYYVYIPVLFCGYFILSKMIDKLTLHYGISSNMAEGDFSNTTDGLTAVLTQKFERIFSFNGIKSILITFFGQIETGNIVMIGVLLSGLVVGGVFIVRFLLNKEENIYLFVINLIALGGIVLTIIGQGIMGLGDFALYEEDILNELLRSRRTNVYLRYYNVYVGPLIMSSFIFLYSKISKIKYSIIPCLLVMSIVAKKYLLLFGDMYSGCDIFVQSPTYNVFSLGGILIGKNKLTEEVIGVLIVVSLFLMIFFLYLARKNMSYSAMILSVFFIIQYLINVKYVYNPNSLNLYNQNIGFYNTLKCVSEQAKIPDIIYLPEEDTEEYRLQFFLNQYNIKFAKPSGNQDAVMIYRKRENINCGNVDVYEIEGCGYIVVQGDELKDLFFEVIGS